jgi:prepilin-type N-terminal cleavage/methylation domain-containing protein
MGTTTRRGFSMPELLMVVVIIGLVTALAIPRINNFREQSDLNAAAALVNSYVYRARAAAIGQARTVRLVTSGSSIWVIIPTTGDTVASQQNLALDRKVTMAASVAQINYSPRGMAVGLSAEEPPRFTLTKGSRTKVVCLTALGMVRPSC